MSRAGCQTCKFRRIKCDEAKPTCQRCAKSRRICLEQVARKPARFSIHIENRYASGKTKRPRGPRPSLTLFHPTLDLSSQAVAYYLNHHLYALADLPTVSACMSECLTAWKASKRESNMVDLAFSTLALAIFSRTQQHTAAATEASRKYGRLLRVAQEQITQVAILGCDERGLDEFLLIIVLMARYETAMHRPANLKRLDPLPSSLHSWSHHDGAEAILKVWNDRVKDNAPSSVIRQSRRGLIRSALLRNRSLPVWLWDGKPFGEKGLDLEFDRIFVRVVNLRRAFNKLEKKVNREPSEVQHLSNEARQLDDECQRWAMQLPREWSFERHRIPSFWPRADFYYSTAYTCARNCFASVWIQYFALRMLISSTLLSLLQLLSHPLQPQLHTKASPPYGPYELPQRGECDASATLNAMAYNLAASIPFSLGRFIIIVAGKADWQPTPTDSQPTLTPTPTLKLRAAEEEEEIPPALALPTIWPLSVASSLRGLEQAQQSWFRAQLARLGRVLGDGALECAGTEGWSHE